MRLSWLAMLVAAALSLAGPSAGEPHDFSQFSDFCYSMMDKVRPAMEYANKVPKVSIEDVMRHTNEEYADSVIRQIAFERASLIWMFGPIPRGELESEVMSVYDNCMELFPACLADGLCIDE